MTSVKYTVYLSAVLNGPRCRSEIRVGDDSETSSKTSASLGWEVPRQYIASKGIEQHRILEA